MMNVISPFQFQPGGTVSRCRESTTGQSIQIEPEMMLDIHWPSGFTPDDADLFAHNEISIGAPCFAVWQHLVEAPKWPEWYPNAQQVKILHDLNGRLRPDAMFEFYTFGIDISAQVSEFEVNRRLAWFGDGDHIEAYHTWLLVPAAFGCQVVTEAVAKGREAIALREEDPDALKRGHQLWLRSLKQIAEP